MILKYSFLNQINEEIPRNGVIDQKTINNHDLSYQRPKDVPDFLFGGIRIRDCRYEPYSPAKMKL